ncbi:MAG: glycosyltransferase family 39 protein [Planctomycetes bacterium]|nr:glycosyltransferase family 39 protein [Planctomycetota bacterium]
MLLVRAGPTPPPLPPVPLNLAPAAADRSPAVDRGRLRFLFLLFAVALLLRLGAVVARGPGRVEFPDSRQYLEMAENFDRGRGFVFEQEAAGRVPGYPFLLWLLGRAFGEPVVSVKVLQALLGAVGALLAYFIGSREFGEGAGRVAGVLVALDPFLIFFATQVLVEAPISTVLLLLLFALLRLADDFRPGRAAVAGLLAGGACLFHPNQLAYLGFLLPFWLLRAGRARLFPALRAYALVLLFALLAILPWSVRNYRVLGRVVPLTARLGDGLYEAFCPEADGSPVKDRMTFPRGVAGLSEADRDRFLRAEAWRLIAADPGRALGLAWTKFLRFWNLVPNFAGYRTPFYDALSLTTYAPVLFAALAGLALCGRGLREKALLASPTLYNMSLHLIFVSSLRFRIPVFPFFALFAAHAAASWWRGRRRTPAAAPPPGPRDGRRQDTEPRP